MEGERRGGREKGREGGSEEGREKRGKGGREGVKQSQSDITIKKAEVKIF